LIVSETYFKPRKTMSIKSLEGHCVRNVQEITDTIQLKRLPPDTIQPLARSKSLSRLNIEGKETSNGT
jgi:hypothetical protein